jgi:nicotinate dehydrogenase medium molybdopterin subunit
MIRYGRGVATIIYPIGATAYSNPSRVFVKVTEQGRAVVLTGTSDVGQGSDTILSQIAAEELGLAFEQIELYSGNTRISPYDHGAGASRQTYIAGNALRMACEKVRNILLTAAAKLTDTDVDLLEIQEGYVVSKNNSTLLITIADLAHMIYQEEIHPFPIAEGHFDPDVTSLDNETGQGKPFSMYAFGTQIADVAVDDETGKVWVLRVAAAHDVGLPVNPMLIEGQIIGGVAMGLGYGLMEEVVVNETGVQNPNFVDYVIPTVMDMPEVHVALVPPSDNKNKTSKGIGEPSTVPIAPAIANAIFDAVGVRLYELPMKPENVLKAIRAKSLV